MLVQQSLLCHLRMREREEEQLSRSLIFSDYTGWYDSLRSIKSRGSQARRPGSLAGLAELRAETLSQFFTPDRLVRFMWDLAQPWLNQVTRKGYKARVFDNSFGSGRMFQFCDPARHELAGIEVDRDCVMAVREVIEGAGFKFALEHGSMEEFRPRAYHLGLLNPPFSIMLDSPVCEPFESGAWGRYGPNSAHKSHSYAVAQALKACRMVMAVVPRSFAELAAKDPQFAPRLHTTFHLPGNLFLEEGARVDTSLLVWAHKPVPRKRVVKLADLEFKPEHAPNIHMDVPDWYGEIEVKRAAFEPGEPAVRTSVTGDNRVRVCHNGRKIILRFHCGLVEARVKNRLLRDTVGGWRPKDSPRLPVGVRYDGEGKLDLENYLAQSKPLKAFDKFLDELRGWGAEPVIEKGNGIRNWLKKRARRIKLLKTPFRHVARLADGGLRDYLRGATEVRAICKVSHGVKKEDDKYHPARFHILPGEEVKFLVTENGMKFSYRRHDYPGNMEMEKLIERYSFPDFVPVDGDWTQVHSGLKKRFPRLYQAQEKVARALGLDKWMTWGDCQDYQWQDIIEVSLKRGHAILGWDMGLGKARAALALCLLGLGKQNLIVAEAKLLEELQSEINAVGLDPSLYQFIHRKDQLVDLRRINIISYSRLRTAEPNAKGKKRFPYAERLRRRIHTVVADECQNLKNSQADQTRAVWRINAKANYGLTGTPIDNFPRDMLPILQFVAGDGTAVQPFGVRRPFMDPGNLEDMDSSNRAIDVFRSMFVVTEWITNEFAEDLQSGAKREIPKINDVVGFRKLVAPFVKRRLQEEPEVSAYVKVPRYTFSHTTLDWDEEHLRYYLRVSKRFVDWFKEVNEEKRNTVAMLAKVQAVITACNIPQAGVEMVGGYGPLTSKQRHARDRLELLARRGHKIVFIAQSPATLELFAGLLEDKKIRYTLFHGGIPIARRVKHLDRFRHGDAQVLLATKMCFQTGYNVWQADRGIFYDRAWTPKVEMQTMKRLLRPQQTKVVDFEFYHLAGSIDCYQAQVCDFKRVTMGAGLDYGEDNLDVSSFLHVETILGRFVEDFEKKFGKLDTDAPLPVIDPIDFAAMSQGSERKIMFAEGD